MVERSDKDVEREVKHLRELQELKRQMAEEDQKHYEKICEIVELEKQSKQSARTLMAYIFNAFELYLRRHTNATMAKKVVSFLTRPKRSWALDEFETLVSRAAELVPHYDVGVALTTNGTWPGYVFEMHGLPVLIAKAKRRGRFAQCDFYQQVAEDDFEDKRVLILDDTIESGRTLRRVVRDVSTFNPAVVDAFLLTHVINFDYDRLSVIYFNEQNKNAFAMPELRNCGPCGASYLLAQDYSIDGLGTIHTLNTGDYHLSHVWR